MHARQRRLSLQEQPRRIRDSIADSPVDAKLPPSEESHAKRGAAIAQQRANLVAPSPARMQSGSDPSRNQFELYDPSHPIDVFYRKLPHWYQPTATCFITFRTSDSMPAETLNSWHAARTDWLQRHGIDPSSRNWPKALEQLPAHVQNTFRRYFSRAYEETLDKGYGECVLRRPELREIVAQTLRFFDGIRYHLGDFVVMPNHVHLLACFNRDTTVVGQCKSWKKFSAAQINGALGRRGHFWQAESFDHLIRNPDQYAYLRQYIADNPRNAGLQEGDYLYYRYPDVRQ